MKCPSIIALLGNVLLLDNHINMMMKEHSHALEEDTSLKDKVIVVPSKFAEEIQNNGET